MVSEAFDEPEIIEAASGSIAQERHWTITTTRVVPETSEGRRNAFLREAGELLPKGGSHRIILLDEAQSPPCAEADRVHPDPSRGARGEARDRDGAPR